MIINCSLEDTSITVIKLKQFVQLRPNAVSDYDNQELRIPPIRDFQISACLNMDLLIYFGLCSTELFCG